MPPTVVASPSSSTSSTTTSAPTTSTSGSSAGGAGFGSQWGAGFVHTVRSVVGGGDDAGRDMRALRAAIEQRFNGDAFQRVVYTESHDEVAESAHQARVPELIWPGRADSFDS